MKITVHRMAIAESLPPHLTIELKNNARFIDLIDVLDSKYDGGIRDQLIEHKKLREGVLVLVNGKTIHQLGGTNLKLKDGDDIFISVTVFGG